ncbi:MAG: hypothetical protein V1753_07455 [Pseudomonadota bacterium]
MTLSIPDIIARRFQATVPPRQRSRLIARLLEQKLAEDSDMLAAACLAANRDRILQKEIDEWQSFSDDVQE